jgi:DNA-binding transcriptional LysR family regulator
VTWAEVAQESLCLLTADMQNRRIVNRHLALAGARVQAMVESNSTIALIAHVRTGQWASIVPKRLAEIFADDGLHAIPIVEPEAEHLVGLINPKRDPQTPLLSALIDEANRFAARARQA